MARPLRIQYPGAWYHITCRGNERGRIYRDDRDRKKFLELLRESVRGFSVEVHCYVLMSNHFHFLLKTLLANLDRFMQRFNTAYIVYFNRRHRRSGHLYQGRYKAILIEADSYLLELSRYIHLNPVRLKRLAKASLEEKIELLEKYPWSSYQSYMGRKGPSFLHREMILSMIGGEGGQKGKEKEYREFVLDGLREGLDSPLSEKRALSVLGGKKFVEWVYSTFVKEKEEEKEYSKLRELAPAVTVEEIAEEAGKEFGMKPGELIRRYSRAGEARQALIDLCCRYAIQSMSLKEIGQELGISAGGLARGRDRFRGKLKKDRALAARIERIERRLFKTKGGRS